MTVLFSKVPYRHFNPGTLERFEINEDENEEGPRRGPLLPDGIMLDYSSSKLQASTVEPRGVERRAVAAVVITNGEREETICA